MTDSTTAADGEAASRRARLFSALDSLATPQGRPRRTGWFTMTVAALFAGAGLGLVLLGWLGASRTINLHEQVPYLISGGLFGLGLCFLGGSAYFAYWIAAVVVGQREQTESLVAAQREDADRIIAALDSLAARLPPPAGAEGPDRPADTDGAA